VLQTLVNKPRLEVKVVGKGGGQEEEGVEREVRWAQQI
jgi:hypothetical protein